MDYQQVNESIELDFIPGVDTPEVVFDSIKLMFSHIILLQTEVIRKVDPLLDIDFRLLNIRQGSIFSDYVKKILVPDANNNVLAFTEPKGDLLGYLDGAQNAVVDVIAENPGTIVDNDMLQAISNRIELTAQETSVYSNLNYRAPNKIILAESIEVLESSVKYLKQGEHFYLNNESKHKKVDKVYTRFNKDELRKETAGKILESPFHIMLKVKIADFLGKSRWKFKLADGRTIEAKITDTNWLNMFHLKSVVIGPGDSIEVQGTVKDMYDDYGKLIDSDYTITKVVKIHEAENQREIDL